MPGLRRSLLGVLLLGVMAPAPAQEAKFEPALFGGLEWRQAREELEDIFTGDVTALNALLSKHGVGAVHVGGGR